MIANSDCRQIKTSGLEAVKKSTRGLHRTIAERTKVRTLQG